MNALRRNGGAVVCGAVLGAILGWLADHSIDDTKHMLAVWLREPILPTDEQGASRSRAIYGYESRDGRWWTSRLGVLNGWLTPFKLHLVVPAVDAEPVAPYLAVWWEPIE